VHRSGTGFKTRRDVFVAVFMAQRVHRRRLAIMTVNMHRTVSVTVLVSVRSAFDPDVY